jgi:hypothetical protein
VLILLYLPRYEFIYSDMGLFSVDIVISMT